MYPTALEALDLHSPCVRTPCPPGGCCSPPRAAWPPQGLSGGPCEERDGGEGQVLLFHRRAMAQTSLAQPEMLRFIIGGLRGELVTVTILSSSGGLTLDSPKPHTLHCADRGPAGTFGLFIITNAVMCMLCHCLGWRETAQGGREGQRGPRLPLHPGPVPACTTSQASLGSAPLCTEWEMTAGPAL